jgi:hypothetical protein
MRKIKVNEKNIKHVHGIIKKFIENKNPNWGYELANSFTGLRDLSKAKYPDALRFPKAELNADNTRIIVKGEHTSGMIFAWDIGVGQTFFYNGTSIVAHSRYLTRGHSFNKKVDFNVYRELRRVKFREGSIDRWKHGKEELFEIKIENESN